MDNEVKKIITKTKYLFTYEELRKKLGLSGRVLTLWLDLNKKTIEIDIETYEFTTDEIMKKEQEQKGLGDFVVERRAK